MTETNTLVAGCAATIIPSTVTALNNGAFSECIGLKSIVIPPSVTSIGEHTFDCCYDMDTIVLPSQLTYIGSSAFAGCERLVYLDIPGTVTAIGDSAFYDCPWLNYLVLGEDLNSIGHCAFDGANLITVTCRAMTPPAMAGEDSFWHYGSFSDATLKVPAPALDRYRTDDYWSLFPIIVANGDVNGDVEIDINDVTSLIGLVLSGNWNSTDHVASDMNDDRVIDINDVTALISLLLHGYQSLR